MADRARDIGKAILEREDANTGDGLVRLPDARRMSYRVYGDRHARAAAVIALHGTPGSRLKFSAAAAGARGERAPAVIALDRWGYADTDMHPAPSLAAFADDAALLADALALRQFAVMGVSGGTPYATAIAARMTSRVTALALVSPVGPIAEEPDREISAFHRFCFGSLSRRPRVTALVFQGFRRLLKLSPRAGMSIAMARVPRADRAILARGTTRDRLVTAFNEGLRAGSQGPAIDLELFGKPWGFSPADVSCPARVWIGTADRNVPVSAAKRLASRLPKCMLTELPDEGHLWVAEHYEQVLGWISDTQKARAEPRFEASIGVNQAGARPPNVGR